MCLKKVYLHQSLIRYIDIILNVKYLKNLGEPKYLLPYARIKKKHLERMATDLLKADEKVTKMKGYKLKRNPLDLF